MMTQKITDFSPEIILITDGSFQSGVSSYPIARCYDKQCELVYANRVPDNVGIFVAELAGLHSAIKYAAEQQKKNLLFAATVLVPLRLLGKIIRGYMTTYESC